MNLRNTTKPEATCAWCSKPIQSAGRGRPRKYCSHSCRQRAYEQRNNVSGTSIPDDAVILTQERASNLSDQLFQLRCAAEDIKTAAEEGAPAQEISLLCSELVTLAEAIERLRVKTSHL